MSKQRKIIIIVAVVAILIIGVAIPKLTVRSAVVLSGADAQCVQANIKQQLNHPLQRIALFFGKSAVIGVQKYAPSSGDVPIRVANTFVVKSYTLFRIPLPVNEKFNRAEFPSLQAGEFCSIKNKNY